MTTAKTFLIELIADQRFNETEQTLKEQSDKVKMAACWNILSEYPVEHLKAGNWVDRKGNVTPKNSPDYGDQWRQTFKLVSVATRKQIYQWVNEIRPQLIKFIH